MIYFRVLNFESVEFVSGKEGQIWRRFGSSFSH